MPRLRWNPTRDHVFRDLCGMGLSSIQLRYLVFLSTRIGLAPARIQLVGRRFMEKKEFTEPDSGWEQLAEEVLRACKLLDIEIISLWCAAYPENLRQCADAPVLLYRRGAGQNLPAEVNATRKLAVVGSRRSSEYGLRQAAQIVKQLAACRNLELVSGLAFGVDAAAHKAALQSGIQTTAILANGLDAAYPAGNRALAGRILDAGGCWISEFPPGIRPRPGLFPRRNRIIAGYSDAVLVIESDRKGGSMITASLANSYDREVMALPGRVDTRTSRGCHHLIRRNYAALVTSAEDVLDYLNWPADQRLSGEIADLLTGRYAEIVRVLDRLGAASVDEIAVETGSAGEDFRLLNMQCVEAELEGLISRDGDGKYVLAGPGA